MKWLANELAAVAGELERIEVELVRLQARKEHLRGVHAALSDVAGLLTVPELPAVVPAVKAHRDLGGRGSLRNCIREALKAAHPQALDTLALTEVVVARFGLTFPNAKARQRSGSTRSITPCRSCRPVAKLSACTTFGSRPTPWGPGGGGSRC